MYPIDFSQGRKKKQQTQLSSFIPKFTPKMLIAFCSVGVLLLCSVVVIDFVSASRGNAKIREMMAFAEAEDGKLRTKMRKLAGVKPKLVTKGSKLYEIYSFDRTIPIFPDPQVTVVYSTAGRVVKILDGAKTAMLESE